MNKTGSMFKGCHNEGAFRQLSLQLGDDGVLYVGPFINIVYWPKQDNQTLKPTQSPQCDVI